MDNTRPFLCSSIVRFWITLAHFKVNIAFSGNIGTPEMFQYSPILGCSSILSLKYAWVFHLVFSCSCFGVYFIAGLVTFSILLWYKSWLAPIFQYSFSQIWCKHIEFIWCQCRCLIWTLVKKLPIYVVIMISHSKESQIDKFFCFNCYLYICFIFGQNFDILQFIVSQKVIKFQHSKLQFTGF